ncbi:MAG: hypothetical protein AAFV46_02150 [Cyanobacteria bacterium J06635_11]
MLRSFPIPFLSPELYELIADLKQSRESIDVKIDEASDSLRKTAELIDEIEQNLKSRTQKLSALREELERYSALAEVEEEKARAIVQQIELATNSGKTKERWISFLINIGAGLLLGLILSPAITMLFQSPTAIPSNEQSQPAIGIEQQNNPQ